MAYISIKYSLVSKNVMTNFISLFQVDFLEVQEKQRFILFATNPDPELANLWHLVCNYSFYKVKLKLTKVCDNLIIIY